MYDNGKEKKKEGNIFLASTGKPESLRPWWRMIRAGRFECVAEMKGAVWVTPAYRQISMLSSLVDIYRTREKQKGSALVCVVNATWGPADKVGVMEDGPVV